MEPREDSAFLPLRSPFFSISKPPLNPNHISRFQTKPFSLYNTRGIDLNHSDQSFHLTSRLLGGGPATLDGFSSNPFELGFGPFYTNEGVSKNVKHGGRGQYHDDTRPPNNNNNNDNDNDDQKALENEGDDENLTNMAYMQHDDDDDDDVSKKKERRKEQEDDGEGGIIKGQWSEEDDRRLAELVEINGNKKWSSIARELKWRLGKQCRERWNNHLRPEIKKCMWSEEEDKILIEAHKELGTRWAEITKRLPGRSENTIKNHWNAVKRKRYLKRKSKGTIDINVNESLLLSNYIKSVEKLEEKKNGIEKGDEDDDLDERMKKGKGKENYYEDGKSRAVFGVRDKEAYRRPMSWLVQLKVEAADRKVKDYDVDATMERSLYCEFDDDDDKKGGDDDDDDGVDLIEMINSVKQDY